MGAWAATGSQRHCKGGKINGDNAPVAQLDRVPGYEPGGRRFESFRARQFLFLPFFKPVGLSFRGLTPLFRAVRQRGYAGELGSRA